MITFEKVRFEPAMVRHAARFNRDARSQVGSCYFEILKLILESNMTGAQIAEHIGQSSTDFEETFAQWFADQIGVSSLAELDVRKADTMMDVVISAARAAGHTVLLVPQKRRSSGYLSHRLRINGALTAVQLVACEAVDNRQAKACLDPYADVKTSEATLVSVQVVIYFVNVPGYEQVILPAPSNILLGKTRSTCRVRRFYVPLVPREPRRADRVNLITYANAWNVFAKAAEQEAERIAA